MGLFWNHKFNDRHNDHGQLYSPFHPDYIQAPQKNRQQNDQEGKHWKVKQFKT